MFYSYERIGKIDLDTSAYPLIVKVVNNDVGWVINNLTIGGGTGVGQYGIMFQSGGQEPPMLLVLGES